MSMIVRTQACVIFVQGTSICQSIDDKDHLEISNHLTADSYMSALGNGVCIVILFFE